MYLYLYCIPAGNCIYVYNVLHMQFLPFEELLIAFFDSRLKKGREGVGEGWREGGARGRGMGMGRRMGGGGRMGERDGGMEGRLQSILMITCSQFSPNQCGIREISWNAL